MQKKHYFLLAALVVYQRDKLERQKPLNVLIPSDTATVNRGQLGRAQQQAQVRFFTEFDRERKSEVVDVFVQSVSYLGEMTEKEFHAEFYIDLNAPDPVEPAPEAGVPVEEQVETGQPDGYATDPQVQAEAPATDADNEDKG